MDYDYYSKYEEPLIRHYISVPFKDNRGLESLVVELLDSAQHTIKLSTPYFNLTKSIMKAFGRAISRGVKLSLLTRLDLEGDTADIILSDVK